MSELWGIPSLRRDKLSALIPTRVYAGGPVVDPVTLLFLWRTAALSKARGCTVTFYVWDSKLEQLWRRPQHYTELFLRHGIATLAEPDFSIWADDALAVQVFNTYRSRWLGRYWQEAGLRVIPSLNWAGPDSYSFCFAGIPVNAPVVAVECRTPGGNDDDRRAFLAGLAEGVRQVQPQHIVIYGGKEHAFWLADTLPHGPGYTLLPSWTYERGNVRKREARAIRDRHQIELFAKGAKPCTEGTFASA